MENNPDFEVIIIGGSYAGLSAAMSLGRSLRKALIIDSGKPCNWQTAQAQNFITHDGKAPAAIAKEAKHQVLQYPTIEFISDKATEALPIEFGFHVKTETGKNFTAKKIILATGVKDIMPDLKGFAECWGISVLHCPYCHGYEVKNEKLGVLADGAMAYELSRLISNWSPNLTIFTNGIGEIELENLEKLERNNIKVVEKQVVALNHNNGYLKNIEFSDGTKQEISAIFSHPACQQHSDIPEKLGCERDENGLINVDHFQKTSVPGVFAVGDCTTLFRALSAAIASGNKAGAVVNKELIEENF